MLQEGEKVICNSLFTLWCVVVMITIFLRNIQFLMPVVSCHLFKSLWVIFIINVSAVAARSAMATPWMEFPKGIKHYSYG